MVGNDGDVPGEMISATVTDGSTGSIEDQVPS
jgi:hypothetical protein